MDWIWTKSRLPEPGVEVIAWGDKGFACNAIWDGVSWWRSNCGYGFVCWFSDVTHWIPMPERGPDNAADARATYLAHLAQRKERVPVLCSGQTTIL